MSVENRNFRHSGAARGAPECGARSSTTFVEVIRGVDIGLDSFHPNLGFAIFHSFSVGVLERWVNYFLGFSLTVSSCRHFYLSMVRFLRGRRSNST